MLKSIVYLKYLALSNINIIYKNPFQNFIYTGNYILREKHFTLSCLFLNRRVIFNLRRGCEIVYETSSFTLCYFENTQK